MVIDRMWKTKNQLSLAFKRAHVPWLELFLVGNERIRLNQYVLGKLYVITKQFDSFGACHQYKYPFQSLFK